MFKNHLRTALRNLIKTKTYSLINIIGFAVGMAVCILISLWVIDEITFDNFHEHSEHIYRVSMHGLIGSNEFDIASGPILLADKLQLELGGLRATTRLSNQSNPYIRYEDKVFKESDFLFADANIFNIFKIEILRGNPAAALQKPNSIILTESTATKYFGDENPIGKTLSDDQGRTFQVTAIAEDYPGNSHFDFDFLASLSTIEEELDQSWVSNTVYTYLLLAESQSPQQVQSVLDQIVQEEIIPLLEAYTGVSYSTLEEGGNYFRFGLQPLNDIHLHSRLSADLKPGGDIKTVRIFALIAIIILIVSCINYINLTTARAIQRAHEIGIRKIVGSSRAQIVRQFLLESTLTTILSAFFAIILIELAMPLFNSISGKDLQLAFQSGTILIILLVAILVSLIAGIYPAIVLSSFRPLQVLKQKGQSSSKSGRLRNLLVIFQFAASTALIIGTVVVSKQLHYAQHKNLGYDQEHVFVLRNARYLRGKSSTFKNELLTHPDIRKVSFSNGLPGARISATIFNVPTEDGMETHTLIYKLTDPDFLPTYRMEMAQGRYFRHDMASDSNAIILSETTVGALGMTDPIGRKLYLDDNTLTVIGVVKDFHLQSIHETIRPMANLMLSEEYIEFASIRLAPGDPAPALRYIENTWKQFLPEQPMDSFFSEELFERQYRSEIQMMKLFRIFAGLTIIIACLGLFGLASYITQTKLHEIGIRKVLGATTYDISILLGLHFLRTILLASLIAWPLAGFYMHRWLHAFAYRTSLSWWIFPLSAGAAFLLALITVSYHSLRTAFRNPVDIIHYE